MKTRISDKYLIDDDNNTICDNNYTIIYNFKLQSIILFYPNSLASLYLRCYLDSTGSTNIMMLNKINQSITIYNVENNEETIINDVLCDCLVNCKSYSKWIQLNKNINSITDDGINFIKTDYISDYEFYFVFEKYIIFQYSKHVDVYKIEVDYQLTLVYVDKYDKIGYYSKKHIFDNILVMVNTHGVNIVDLTNVDNCMLSKISILYVRHIDFNYMLNIVKIQKFFTSDEILEIDASKYRNMNEQIKLCLPALII